MVKVPLRVPVALGANVTLITQRAVGATGPAEHVGIPSVIAKSPVTSLAVIVSCPVPVLVTVTDCDALTVPWAWESKLKLIGDKDTAGFWEYANLVESRLNSRERDQRTRGFI
jgi:hypothetical protein